MHARDGEEGRGSGVNTMECSVPTVERRAMVMVSVY